MSPARVRWHGPCKGPGVQRGADESTETRQSREGPGPGTSVRVGAQRGNEPAGGDSGRLVTVTRGGPSAASQGRRSHSCCLQRGFNVGHQ